MQWKILSVLAMATVAAAQAEGFDVMSIPATQETYAVGSTLPITWAPGSSTGSISLTLIGGAGPSSLNPLLKIASGINATLGTYSWLIPADAGTLASYGINLTSDVDPNTFQYSNAFHISGGSAGGSGSASTTSGSGSSTSASFSKTSTTSGTAVATVTGSTTQIETSATAGTTTGTSTSPITLVSTTKSSSSVAKSSGGSSSTSSSAVPSATSKTSGGDVMMLNSKFALLGGLVVAVAW